MAENAFVKAQAELAKFMQSANAQIPVQLIQPILVQYVDLVQDNSRLCMDMSRIKATHEQLMKEFDNSKCPRKTHFNA